MCDSIQFRFPSGCIVLALRPANTLLLLTSGPAADALRVPGLAGFLLLRRASSSTLGSTSLLLLVYLRLCVICFFLLCLLAPGSHIFAVIVLLDLVFFLRLLILVLALSAPTLVGNIQLADSLDDIVARTRYVYTGVVLGSILLNCIPSLRLNCDLALGLDVRNCPTRCASSPVP